LPIIDFVLAIKDKNMNLPIPDSTCIQQGKNCTSQSLSKDKEARQRRQARLLVSIALLPPNTMPISKGIEMFVSQYLNYRSMASDNM